MTPDPTYEVLYLLGCAVAIALVLLFIAAVI